ncbi:unnamed protein product [Allacma fusca]|uniref:Uncharacterized protein n=1 Tax=Allacma fusca TaxID=39272 RepID=A0A8J2JKN0_9HEXA|nr:unnamed protein product [Allacma fusca]
MFFEVAHEGGGGNLSKLFCTALPHSTNTTLRAVSWLHNQCHFYYWCQEFSKWIDLEKSMKSLCSERNFAPFNQECGCAEDSVDRASGRASRTISTRQSNLHDSTRGFILTPAFIASQDT